MPELRPLSSSALTWYNNSSNSSFATLYQVEKEIRLLGSNSSAADGAESSLNTLIAQRNAKETEWRDVTKKNATPSIISIKLSELISLSASVLAAQSAFSSAVDNNAFSAESQKQNLITTLNGLSLISTHEVNMKAVLLALLQPNNGNAPFSGSQLSTLTDIANQCRLAGGYAVVIARNALIGGGNYDAIDLPCGVESRSDWTPN